jgi:hypothetical protein
MNYDFMEAQKILKATSKYLKDFAVNPCNVVGVDLARVCLVIDKFLKETGYNREPDDSFMKEFRNYFTDAKS